MERRIHKRVYVNERAQMVLDDKSYNGYIVNVSEGGVSYMITSLLLVRDELIQNKEIELSFRLPSGMSEILNCEVVWIKKGIYTGNIIALGVKLIGPSPGYKDWLRQLYIKNSIKDIHKSGISS